MAKRNTKPKRTPSKRQPNEGSLAQYGVKPDLFKKATGRPKGSTKYNGEELKELFLEYIEERARILWKDGFGHKKRLPLTHESFCVFLGIGFSTWNDWTKRTDDESFSEVINIIKNTIKANQIDGAIIGQYKENIIARLNGIGEKIENDTTTSFRVVVEKAEDEQGDEE